MDIIFSDEVAKILEYSRDEALRTGRMVISVDQLMLGIIRHDRNRAVEILKALGVSTGEMKQFLDEKTFLKDSIPYAELEYTRFTMAAHTAICCAHAEAMSARCSEIYSEHMLLAICRSRSNATKSFMAAKKISYDSVAGKIEEFESMSKSGMVRIPDLRVIAAALSEQLGNIMNRNPEDSSSLYCN